MFRTWLGLLVLAVLVWLVPDFCQAQQFTLKQDDAGVTVHVDGQLFTRYLVKSGAKPVLFPVVGPNGAEMTRGYPIIDAKPEEKKDHIHHRSFWFTHGDVNGTSFWHEEGGNGTIEHREFVELKEGNQAVIATRNEWLAADGTPVCEDVRRFQFGAESDRRWIDVTIQVKAPHGKVTFGDTKEGSFGVRVAGTMRAEREDGGRIVNSEGQVDGDAWGQPAAWVDYSGPVGDQTVGLAILNHPSSFRYPTHWHVRTYGLFAANPFGLHDFLKDPSANGAHVLEKGESFTLKYRVLLHVGDAEAGRVAEEFARYAKTN